MSKPGQKRKCVFCAGQRVTKEHAIPAWLAATDPFKDVVANYKPTTNYSPRTAPIGKNALGVAMKSSVSPRANKIIVRTVCGPCNNGWMAELEKAVNPIVMRYLDGQNVALSDDEATVLYRWAVKTSIMCQYTDRSTLTATHRQLQQVYRGATQVEHTKVLIGWYSGPLKVRTIHEKFGTVKKSDFSAVSSVAGRTFLVFGKLALVVIGGSTSEMAEWLLAETGKKMRYVQELNAERGFPEIFAVITDSVVNSTNDAIEAAKSMER